MLHDDVEFDPTIPVATEDAPLSELERLPVIAADDVALYCSAFKEGTDVSNVVASLAPPFDQFFIEFQRVPNQWGLHAWGAHFKVTTDHDEIARIHHGPPDDTQPRWVYRIAIYLEKIKGQPYGPAASHVCGLAEDGTLFRHSDGKLYWGGGLPSMYPEPSKSI